MSTEVRVLLVDDHRVFVDVLRTTLGARSDLRCVAVAHTVAEARAQVAAVPFDVAVVDLDLPDGGGLDVLRAIAEFRPAARSVVLTAHLRPDLAERALAAGAVAYLGKDGTLDRLLDAVRGASRARPMTDVGRTAPAADALTHRELEVLRLLGVGLDAARVARSLGISLHTTRGHIKAVIGKLGAHTQLGAVVAGQRRGLIRVGSRY